MDVKSYPFEELINNDLGKSGSAVGDLQRDVVELEGDVNELLEGDLFIQHEHDFLVIVKDFCGVGQGLQLHGRHILVMSPLLPFELADLVHVRPELLVLTNVLPTVLEVVDHLLHLHAELADARHLIIDGLSRNSISVFLSATIWVIGLDGGNKKQ